MDTLAHRIEEWLGGRRAVVVGVGNRLRGDDGAGSLVAEQLAPAGEVPAIDAETVPENFLGKLLEAGPEVVLFVDAADHGGIPGSCCLEPARALAHRCNSTHAPSLLLLARILETRGIECWLLGIQPASTAPGTAVSPEVVAGVRAAANALASALGHEAHHA